MSTQSFLNFDLILHITGFTMMAGTILADFAINQKLNRYLITDKPRALSTLDITSAFPRLIGIGAALLITTGIAMVVIFKGTVAQMTWFKIKMVLVLLILLNGTLVLRRGSNQLRKLLQSNNPANDADILTLKSRINIALAFELLFFLTVFILSILRF
ncbi:MAG: DUF2214 family protein [Bacteroidetes bacterium]|nr:DUF2214 family protein [Bacteroidota bacterium]